MKRILRIAALLLFLLPGIAKAQWTFDIVSVEAYINDHKKQRSLLLARSTLEYSNKLLHEYSCKEVGGYKELNIDLDRYTRAFDVIDVMYQSLRTVLNVKNTYTSVSDRIGDYKSLLEDFNAKILKRGRIESADTLIISINARGLRAIAREGEQLYKSVSDLVLYATGAAACSTSDLLMVLEAINRSLDNIERHLNRAYFETWRYIQVRIGYWKAKVYRSRTMREILDDAFGRWRGAGSLLRTAVISYNESTFLLYHNYLALSMICTNLQRFVLLNGRVSMIRTVSPSLQVSSRHSATNFVVLFTNLP